MKTMKKIFALIMALTMVMALVVTANAAGDKGSITINNAANGKNYYLHKVLSATTNASRGIDYDINSAPAALAKYFKVIDKTEGNVTYKQLVMVDDEGKELNANSTIPQAVIDAFKAWAEGHTADQTATAANNKAEFTDVEAGYYVIVSDLGDTIMIDSALDPATQVYEKNTTDPVTSLKKKIDDENDKNVAIGDEVEYTITFGTSNYSYDGENSKPIMSYTIKDALPAGVTYVENTLEVKVGNDKITVSADDLFGNGATIEWATKDETTKAVTSNYAEGAVITIKYTVKVNEKATGSMDNTVTVTPNTADGPLTPQVETDTESITTYKLSVKKVDGQGAQLSGAKFKLYKSAAGTDEVKVVKTGEGKYRVAVEDENGVEIEAGLAEIDGLDADVTYYLEETLAPTGYNILKDRQEVKATASGTSTTDYTLVTANDEFDANATYYTRSGEEGKYTYTPAEVNEKNFTELVAAGNLFIGVTTTSEPAADATPNFGTAEVINNAGAELPSTGGIGTTIFTVVGATLMIGAAVLFVTKKRSIME